MDAKKVNIEFKAGKNYDIKLTYRDNNGVAISITGATGKLVFQKTLSSPSASGTVTAVLGSGTGEIEYKFVPADSSSLLAAEKNFETYMYEAEMTLTSGETYTLIEGTLTITRAIA